MHRLAIITPLLIFLLLSTHITLAQESDSTDSKQSLAIFPAVSYAPETSVALGAVAIWVMKTDNVKGFQRQSTLSPYFLYTFRNQVISAINHNYYTRKGDNLVGSTRFLKYPDFYFGVGNDNDPDVSELYTNVFFRTEGQYLKQLNEKTFLGVAYDLHFTSIKDIVPVGLLETDSPNGVTGGSLLGIGPSFRFDSRNNVLYPSNGYLVSLQSIAVYVGDYAYTNHVADFRKYLQLGNENNILALQFRANFTSGSDIPFFKLPQLSGDDRLRGFTNASLYRDRQLMFSQAEYRRPLFWRLGFVAFAGLGDVAHKIGDFNASDLKYVVGMGGRFALIPERKLNLRLDLGYGKGGQTGIYIGISEAF